MTKITFYKKEKIITGFKVVGHTGKDEYGKDLLCCQISTVAQLAVVGCQVENLKPTLDIRDGLLNLRLSVQEASDDKIQFLFKTCLESFQSIIQDEKKFAKLEVKDD